MNRLDRLRQIVRGADPRRRAGANGEPARETACAAGSDRNSACLLGAVRNPGDGGRCHRLSRIYDASHRYGRQPIGDYPRADLDGLDVLAGVPPVGRRRRCGSGSVCADAGVVCLDLETTGLSGGAGTLAFVIGLGWFAGEAFETCQFVLSSPPAEGRTLAAVADILRGAHTLVTFNGRSFDGPVIEMRLAFHRLPSPIGRLRHVDLLHPGRHLWKGDEARLISLEREVLGVSREGDVPGAEIPGRYQAFLRTGRADVLAPVLEHNRLDLVSLGLLTGLACALVRDGGARARTPSQALGVGRLFEKVGLVDDAVSCYRRAAGLEVRDDTEDIVRCRSAGADLDAVAEALSRLGAAYRRQHRHGEAAAVWARLLRLPEVAVRWRREASVALAIHHEHRARDLEAARRFATAALAAEDRTGPRRAVEHRLMRLDRKLGQRPRLV